MAVCMCVYAYVSSILNVYSFSTFSANLFEIYCFQDSH